MLGAQGPYETLLATHSILRWAILAVGLTAAARAGFAQRRARPRTDADTRVARMFTILLDLQFLLGVVIYALFSPVIKASMTSPAQAMRDGPMRFWIVEHPVAMVLAIVLAHVGLKKSRRSSGNSAHRSAAIYFTLAILIILCAIPWPFLPYGRPLWPPL